MSHKKSGNSNSQNKEELEKVAIWLQLDKLSINLTKLTLCCLNHQGRK